MTDVQIIKQLKASVGDKLIGDEGFGPTVIEITAIGDTAVLAKAISHNGLPFKSEESMWTLRYRDWKILK